MPQMDGFEVLAYMNKEHWIDYIPVIIISAEDSPAYIKRGYDLGVTDFIASPLMETWFADVLPMRFCWEQSSA